MQLCVLLEIIPVLLKIQMLLATIVSFLTPSQLTSVLLVLAAIVVFAGERYFDRLKSKLTEENANE